MGLESSWLEPVPYLGAEATTENQLTVEAVQAAVGENWALGHAGGRGGPVRLVAMQ